MGINLAGRGRRRLVLGVLAAGVVGATALGGAMAASAAGFEDMEGPVQPTIKAADAEIDRLREQCEAKGGTEVKSNPMVVPGSSPAQYRPLLTCHVPDRPEPNRDNDFFSFV